VCAFAFDRSYYILLLGIEESLDLLTAKVSTLQDQQSLVLENAIEQLLKSQPKNVGQQSTSHGSQASNEITAKNVFCHP